MPLPFLEQDVSLFRTWNSCMEINMMPESKYSDFTTEQGPPVVFLNSSNEPVIHFKCFLKYALP